MENMDIILCDNIDVLSLTYLGVFIIQILIYLILILKQNVYIMEVMVVFSGVKGVISCCLVLLAIIIVFSGYKHINYLGYIVYFLCVGMIIDINLMKSCIELESQFIKEEYHNSLKKNDI